MLFQAHKTLKHLIARYRGNAQPLILPPQLRTNCCALHLQLDLRWRFAVTQAVIEQLLQHLSQRLSIKGNGCQLTNDWQQSELHIIRKILLNTPVLQLTLQLHWLKLQLPPACLQIAQHQQVAQQPHQPTGLLLRLLQALPRTLAEIQRLFA